MATAAKIDIKLDAQTAALKKGFAEARGAVDNLGKGMSGHVAMGLAKFHAGLALAKGALNSLRGAINEVLASMADIDATEKFADRIGIASDQLRILNFAAEQTGASAATMQMALQRMTRRISEAAAGSGEAVKALQELGLSAEYLATLSPDKQFGAIADAMGGVTAQGDKVRLAMKLFDSEGVALVNTLAEGSAGLNKFGAEAEGLGMLVGDQGGKIEAANDAINRMKKAWGGLVGQVAIAVAPALAKIADALATIVGWFNRLIGATGKAADFGGAASAAAAAFEPVKAGLDEIGKKTVEKVLFAKKKMVDVAREIAGIEVGRTPAIAPVTRSSAAGFSAIQQARRDAIDAERRHKEVLRVLRDIDAGLRAGRVELAPVGF